MDSFLSIRKILLLCVVFFGGFALASKTVALIDHWYGCYCVAYWPLLILPYWPTALQVAGALIVLLLGWIGFRAVENAGYSPMAIVLFGVLATLATNLLQGFHIGYRMPHLAFYDQYYWDAKSIENVWYFIRNFESLIPSFASSHVKTHPPGAVLLFYVLYEILGSTALMSTVMGIASIVLLTGVLYAFLSLFLDDQTVRFTVFLFIVFPATQIFSVASLDTILGALFLAVLYFFVRERGWQSGIFAFVSLIVLSFTQYAVAFLAPVMAGYEWIEDRSIKWTTILWMGLVGFYVLMFLVSGFNYGSTFWSAYVQDRPGDDPLYFGLSWYIPTRLKDVGSILFFLGPFLTYLAWKGMRSVEWTRDRLAQVGAFGILTLLMVFGVGLYRNGETSRNCFFIYPFLFIFVALGVKQLRLNVRVRGWLFALVFGQSVVMQIVGNYIY